LAHQAPPRWAVMGGARHRPGCSAPRAHALNTPGSVSAAGLAFAPAGSGWSPAASTIASARPAGSAAAQAAVQPQPQPQQARVNLQQQYVTLTHNGQQQQLLPLALPPASLEQRRVWLLVALRVRAQATVTAQRAAQSQAPCTPPLSLVVVPLVLLILWQQQVRVTIQVV
jgi:hypothetical protein